MNPISAIWTRHKPLDPLKCMILGFGTVADEDGFMTHVAYIAVMNETPPKTGGIVVAMLDDLIIPLDWHMVRELSFQEVKSEGTDHGKP